MSLIRFLSSGSRGLTKGAPPMGRYRLPDGRLIPDFGCARNPFGSKTLPPQQKASPAVGVTAKAALTQAALPSPVPLQGEKLALAAGGVMKRKVGMLSGSVSKVKTLCLQLPRLGKRLLEVTMARLPGRGRRVPLASTVAPQPSGPVQGELLLENVRVVRNDLADTDYEVVCSETRTASPVKRAPQSLSVPRESRSLGRLAERLFSHKSS